jgi:hypothetical protein
MGGPIGRRLRLNLVGTSPEVIARVAETEGPRSPAEGLRAALEAARHRLEALGRRRAATRPGQDPPPVAAFLARLQQDLERALRGHRYRTRHAESRHREGGRPTDTALAEAGRVPDARLLRDAQHRTIVVLGRKNRAHVFAEDGRHVTSLQLTPGEAERKAERSRWTPLGPEEVAAFRRALAAASRS